MKASGFEPHHIQSVTLQQIRCFVAVVKGGSYARAEGLGIAQPAVSRAVMRLEDILGAKLFEPGERTKISAFGEKILPEASRMLGMVESLKRLAQDEAGKGRIAGEVTIGTKSVFAETILPKLIGAFRKKYRRVSFRIRCGGGDELLGMLRTGDIDIAVSHERPCPDGIAYKRLWSFPRLLVVPRDHALAKGSLTARRLAEADLILPGRDSQTFAELMRKLSEAVSGERIRRGIEITSAAAQIAYVAQGWGVAVIDGSAEELLTPALLARRLPPNILAERDAGVFYPTQRYAPNVVRKFVEESCGRSARGDDE